MNYILVEVEISGNGVSDIYRTKAISEDKIKLEEYCKKTYGKEIGKPDKFSWDNYFLINKTDIIVL